MASKYNNLVFGKTQQTEKMFGENEVKNNAGGYVFEVSKMQKLDRFLILGSDTNTYYVNAKKLTVENAENILELIKTNGIDVVNRIIEISAEGRAPKNDSAIFALAMCASYGNDATRVYALSNLSKVCRIPTHLFQFVDSIQHMRGWGRGLRKAIAKWYTNKDINELVYHLMKYKNREGWNHKDILKLSHPTPVGPEQSTIFNYVIKDFDINDDYKDNMDLDITRFRIGTKLGEYVGADVNKTCEYIVKYNLPREVVPTAMLKEPKIWEALFANGMPMTAMLRNIRNMTKVGLLSPLSDYTNKVCEMLRNKEAIKKSRLHPISILVALNSYSPIVSGFNFWDDVPQYDSYIPVPEIVDALNDAFYLSFNNVEPTNKRYMLGLDVSGSMCSECYSGLTSAMASNAMAMSIVRSEPRVFVKAFSGKLIDIDISKNTSIRELMDITQKITFGCTDCSLPMTYATKNRIPVDVFNIWTDNETWCGDIHPFDALNKYRDTMGIDAKLVVCATVSSGFSIAKPGTDYMLDIAGFDSSVPQIINEFVKGF